MNDIKSEPTTEKDRMLMLPNGSWVRLSAVTSIEPAMEDGICGIEFPARVYVRHLGACDVIDCVDFDEAKRVASEIAKQVNGEPTGI